MIIRAIVKNGMLQPLQPLPPEWEEGKTVEIHDWWTVPDNPEELEKQWDELEAIIAQTPVDPEDEKRIQEMLMEQKRISKEQVRRQMGLE